MEFNEFICCECECPCIAIVGCDERVKKPKVCFYGIGKPHFRRAIPE